jgi:hypothetical protein
MTICTIVTKSHLALARVLAKSMRAVHPDARVYVLLADRVDGCFDPATEPFHMIQIEDLAQGEAIGQMAFYYNAFEFCCALRPFLHQYIWQHTDAAQWLFLDSDIFITGDVSDIFQSLSRGSILLNPHNTSPAPAEFFETELAQLQVGVFNGGFVGINRCEQSMAFIKWFRSRLKRFGFHDAMGQFVDQLWLIHVPQFFRDVLIYTHPGANLGHWNLYKRTLTTDAGGRIFADGQPLMFVHFSGWNINDPAGVSRKSEAYRSRPFPQLEVWKELGTRYRAALLESGYEQSRNWPYAFGQFDDGTPITLPMRRKYFEELVTGKAPPASPFSRPNDFPKD